MTFLLSVEFCEGGFIHHRYLCTTILLRGKSTDRSVLHSETTGAGQVNVTVESPRYELWAEYFIDETGFEEGDCEVRDDEESVECTIDPDLVYVTQQRIEVSLIL